jgi:RNA polymerase sigma-70 factor (ECF subfamily)
MMALMAEAKNDSHPTRSSLLRRLKHTEDQQSWQEFHDIYARLIRGFAIKAGLNENEAEEVVQETMIAAARHLPDFHYDAKACSFKTWLLNLSHWRLQDQFRKRRTPLAPGPAKPVTADWSEDTTCTPIMERVPDPAGPQQEAIWDQEWKTTLWEAALARVKPQVDLRQWQILDLYVLKEMVGQRSGPGTERECRASLFGETPHLRPAQAGVETARERIGSRLICTTAHPDKRAKI